MSSTDTSGGVEIKQGFGNRTVVTRDYIEITRWGNTQRIQRMALKGFRKTVGRYGVTYYRLFPTDTSAKSVAITVSANKRTQVEAALAGLTDLDKADFDAAMERLKADDNFGATPDERLATLKSEKTQALIANCVAGAIAAWGLVYPHPHDYAIAANAITFPALILLTVFKQGRWRLDMNKNDPRPTAQIGLWASAVALLVRGIFDVDTFDWLPLLGAGAAVAAIGAALAPLMFQELRKIGNVALFALLFGFFGWGAVSEANTTLDHSTGQVFQTQITDKYESHGRSTSYDLVLAPWGPSQGGSESVPYDVYNQYNIGDTACVTLHTGALHMRWYTMTGCEGLSQSSSGGKPAEAQHFNDTPSDNLQTFDKPPAGKP